MHTGIAPDVWLAQDERVLLTALELLTRNRLDDPGDGPRMRG